MLNCTKYALARQGSNSLYDLIGKRGSDEGEDKPPQGVVEELLKSCCDRIRRFLWCLEWKSSGSYLYLFWGVLQERNCLSRSIVVFFGGTFSHMVWERHLTSELVITWSGMMHANVGHKVTLLTLSLRLFCTKTYIPELMMMNSWCHKNSPQHCDHDGRAACPSNGKDSMNPSKQTCGQHREGVGWSWWSKKYGSFT